MDPFGNYLIQKLLDRCSEEQRLQVGATQPWAPAAAACPAPASLRAARRRPGLAAARLPPPARPWSHPTQAPPRPGPTPASPAPPRPALPPAGAQAGGRQRRAGQRGAQHARHARGAEADRNPDLARAGERRRRAAAPALCAARAPRQQARRPAPPRLAHRILSSRAQPSLPPPPQVQLVIDALKPGVVSLIRDLNGNHVVQRCLQRLGPDDSQFVYDAARKHCMEIATHR